MMEDAFGLLDLLGDDDILMFNGANVLIPRVVLLMDV